MTELWYLAVCFTLGVFVLRNRWDFGAGALHRIVAQTEAERRQVFAAIGPLWSWNEVWLIATGGMLVLAFPRLMGLAFSGFYLAVFLLLWALLLRGLAIEVRGHINGPLWQSFWDALFSISNFALIVLLGATIGNVVRGVPLDESGEFFLPLFTTFRGSGRVGLLDWYTLSVAGFTSLALTAHGAGYLALKTIGGVHERSRQLSRRLWVAAGALFVWIVCATAFASPAFYRNLLSRPTGWAVLVLLIGSVALLLAGNVGRSEV